MYKGYWLLNLWYGGRLVIDKEVPSDELQTLLEVRFEFLLSQLLTQPHRLRLAFTIP